MSDDQSACAGSSRAGASREPPPGTARTALQPPIARRLEGVSFRPYRGESDLPGLAGLLRAVDEADGEAMVISLERLRMRFANLSRIDPREDVMLAFAGGRLVAHSTVDWADSADGERHYRSEGHVHPEWRCRGIGRAMAERNERRLRAIAAGQAWPGRAVLTMELQDRDRGGIALAQALGYRRVRVYRHMVRPDLDRIRLLPLPPGLEVRALPAGRLGDWWPAMCEAFRDHFGAWGDSESAFRRWVESPLYDPDLQVVAFDGDQVAGAVHAAIDPVENELRGYRRGWCEPVFTRRPWRRRGLASALLGQALLRLRARGMTSAQLHVDSENTDRAPALYERHGFLTRSSSSEWHLPMSGPMSTPGQDEATTRGWDRGPEPGRAV
jgi:mycothiol synthase